MAGKSIRKQNPIPGNLPWSDWTCDFLHFNGEVVLRASQPWKGDDPRDNLGDEVIEEIVLYECLPPPEQPNALRGFVAHLSRCNRRVMLLPPHRADRSAIPLPFYEFACAFASAQEAIKWVAASTIPPTGLRNEFLEAWSKANTGNADGCMTLD